LVGALSIVSRRSKTRWRLEDATVRLREQQGELPAGPPADPWSQILWENVAYLASDERRAAAFHELETKVGTAPKSILAARSARLRSIGSHGILPEASLKKLRDCATLAMDEFDGDPSNMQKMSTDQLRRVLRKFPGIGVPSMERILLYAHRERILPLDSNGLRVVLRLGYGTENADYARTYASVRRSLEGAIPTDFDSLIEAHGRLRAHGKSLCRRSRPICHRCPLAARCPSREDTDGTSEQEP
jgi:endonuclease III